MFSAPVRCLLIAASVAFGGYQLYRGNGAGGWYLLAAALLIYGYFRYGPVWLALRTARRGSFDRTRRLLAQVPNPAWLTSDQRAYFELASALLAEHRKDSSGAETHLRLALEHRMRTQNDRAIVELMLARILLERGSAVEAGEILDRAANRGSNPEVARMIDELKTTLSGARGRTVLHGTAK
jgi:predicted Zn-dependent protease